MDITTFFIIVFCEIEDWLGSRKLQQREPQPTLSDSEVLTMEIIGEFLGYDTDKGIYTYFRQHLSDWFPGIGTIHRTTFVRQAANLWAIKAELWHAHRAYRVQDCIRSADFID